MPERPARRASEESMITLARLEYGYHAWRERRARRRGKRPTVTPFPGYGGKGWVRVLGRVLIVPPRRRTETGEYASVRGWRSFLGIPVGYAQVQITAGGQKHTVVTDRGGVLDARLAIDLEPGWRTVQMRVEGSEPIDARIFVVDERVRFGVVSDVDDTVMVTALPRPFIAAWNSFVVDEHARLPIPGMAVLLDRLVRENPGSPLIYLSTGAWNIAPTLTRFLTRHLFPQGSMLLTDWGPTHDRWFRSGRDHKIDNLRRLAEEFPGMRWLLIGDDGQADDSIYTQFTGEHPESVAGVAIRRLSPTEAVLAGGRTAVDDHTGAHVPWVTGADGSDIVDELERVGLL